MGAAKKLLDKKVLKDLVPLNALSAVHLEEISRKAIIETVRAGRYVFKAGDRDYQSVYLLEGKVELIKGGREVVGSLVSGSEAARHPLAHKQPRELSVRATGSVTVARIDSSLLDVLLTWDESSGYDVVEIDAEDNGDWMTRMLQSQAFLQLPPSNIHQLLMRLEAVNVRAGDVVVKQNEDGDYFYIVKAGRMAVSRKASARGKEVLLAELGEGACFGEEALVSGTRRNATVTMLTDGSLMRLSKDDFDELLCAPLVHEVDYSEASQLAEKGAMWLDVRLPGEFSNQYIKGSRNLPLSALREQADTLDSDGQYIVCCDTGRRSASGAFILSQRGLDVYTLRNGLMDVPGDALNGTLGAPSRADTPARDAEIIPFESDHVADDAESSASQQTASDTGALSEQLRASEAERKQQQLEAEALRQRVESLESALRDSETQQNELAQQLEKTKQAGDSVAEASENVEKQRAELESELARVREDYQQLGQRTSAVAGERDAASRELEDEIAQRSKIESLLAEVEKSAGEAKGHEAELLAQIEYLGQQASEREKLSEEDFRAEKTSFEQQLKALQDNARDYEQKLESEYAERDVLAGKLADIEQQLKQSQAAERSLNESLQQAESQAKEAEQKLRDELQKEQDALSAEIADLKDTVAGQEQLAAQLQERDQALTDTEKSRDTAQQKLDELVQEMDALRQSLDSTSGESDALKTQLGETTEREDQLNRRVAELEQQLASRESEYESDLGSARVAMTRAQTEVDNLKREQQRLLNRQRKAEEALERERHDHQDEVHRLHKEMKSAAGGSSEGLAAEMEALQAQVSEGARLRDDLEIQLGERSAQMEETQDHAEQLELQLKLAQQSAREAEQQLVESSRLANEEMEIRLDTEQGVQQGLREALEASEKERNSHQETITVINQELEELREAYQQSKQALDNNEGAAAGQLAEMQVGLDAMQAERDELLSSADALKNELDQLRAEAEVHRGLEGMLSGEEGDSAENEALQQAKQNVEMAVRLRTQAEEQVETLSREVKQLKEQLNRVPESLVPVMVEGAIPSLDDNDPHASNPMLSEVSEFENTDTSGSAVLLDEEIVPPPFAISQAPKSGLLKGMLAGLAIGAAAGAGLFWWQVDSGQISLPLAESRDKPLLSSATVVKEAGSTATKPVVPARPAKITQERAVVAPKVARQPAPAAPIPAEKKQAQLERSSIAVSDGVDNEQSPTSVASKTLSGMAAISNASRAFPLARGMPDIPGRSVESTDADKVPTASSDPGIAKPAEVSVPEPVVEPVVVQPAGRFHDRLSNGGAGPAMVRFRADHYLMGSSDVSPQFDERPQHDVRLRAFAIAANETTFNEYDAFARATGRGLPADDGRSREKWPVVNVSWEDARAYTQWLSVQTGARYRLPTEAEWEFVARSGTVTRYWWGEELDKDRANCFDCGSDDGGVQTSRTGSFPANPWGVYDMAGNAREWVQDCYVPNYSRAPADGRAVEVGACANRVVRGGAYSSPSDQLRSTSRDQVDAKSQLDNLGFRVVREY